MFIKYFLEEVEEVQTEEGDLKTVSKFEQLTVVSQWFKENKEHPKYQENLLNLYAMLCVSQDILGSEVLKELSNLKFDSETEELFPLLKNTYKSKLNKCEKYYILYYTHH